MPQRSFAREMVLLSVPLLLIGSVLGWGEWQKRLRTPQIDLSVEFDTNQLREPSKFGFTPDETLRFRWTASLKGGPQSGYRFGWNERLVAKTRRGAVVVWQQNTRPKGWQLDAVGGSFMTNTVNGTFSSVQGLNRCTHLRSYEVDESKLPLDTQKLEWRSEVVAIPTNDADIWQSPLPHATLENWSQMTGAAKWQRTVALPYNPNSPGAVLMRNRKSVEPNSTSKGDVQVEILSRPANRRAFRRLAAFDGKTTRVLWTDGDRLNTYCRSIGNGGYSSRNSESLTFDLSRVPASWGEVVFLCDTVFDVNGRAPIVSVDQQKLNANALAAFERQTGGYRVSRRLVLRSESVSEAQ